MQPQKRIITVFVIITLLLAFSGVIARLAPIQALGAEEAPNVEEPQTTTASVPLFVDNPYIIADIAELASPATVFISVKWPVVTQEEPSERSIPQDPFSLFFDYWFNEPFLNRQPVQPSSAGSGFIIDASGIILTNQHVVGKQTEDQTITVVVDAPGLDREYEAVIIGSDAALDLAVLRIKNDNNHVFPTVPLGDSDASRIGEWTIAIGNPYGKEFEHTVTVGVLSAKGREIAIMNQETGQPQIYENLMQTDAAINRGNSGGPLLNIKGEVIGINTAVHAQAQGIGFAIPINVAKDVLDELITTGSVSKTWLGIYYQNLTKVLAQQLRLPDEKGVLVSDIVQNSPAAEGGLEPWDVIRRIGDRDIFEMNDVAAVIAQHQPGDEILITVLRKDQMFMIPITLGNMPPHLR